MEIIQLYAVQEDSNGMWFNFLADEWETNFSLMCLTPSYVRALKIYSDDPKYTRLVKVDPTFETLKTESENFKI
jgi:hypothetical protein